MKPALPFYTEINDFLASIPWPGRTENPDFYCLRLKPLDKPQVSVYRPPFRRAFYFFALLFKKMSQVVRKHKTVADELLWFQRIGPQLR